MKKSLLITVVISSFVSFGLLGLGAAPAGGKTFGPSNRFAPSGTVSADPTGAGARLSLKSAPRIVPSSSGTGGCRDSSATNVRANQECTAQSLTSFLGRAQSQNETAVAVDPTSPRNILVGQNDYRFGDGKCGVDWSRDGGQHWGSELAPMNFTPGFTAPRHYWDAGGDTSVGFDSSGEAYLMCQAFNRGSTSDTDSNASAFMLFRSADKGASWSFPGSIVTQSDGTGVDGIGLLDKEYMAIDSNPNSKFADRIYVAWAQYSTTFAASPINFAYSADHGVTWHKSGNIVADSAALCPINFSGAPAGTCDADQFADPFVAPNGDVYVAMVNFNNCAGAIGPPCGGDPNDNHSQILIVKSKDGGNTFGDPVKVTDYYELPDCFTYTGQDFGRACVPTAPLSGTSVFRATNYPSGVAISSRQIVVDFGSYINPHSNPALGNCSPNGFSAASALNLYKGVGKARGCNNDILRSVSVDGGATFTGGSTPPDQLPTVSDEGRTLADQWWQWTAKGPKGIATSYFDRKYGTDQSTGFMDFTLARAGGSHARVTDFSLPPSNEFPGTNGYSVFIGDYTGLAVGSDGMAHPAWPDTRNPIMTFNPAGDARVPVFAGYGADIYTRSLPAS